MMPCFILYQNWQFNCRPSSCNIGRVFLVVFNLLLRTFLLLIFQLWQLIPTVILANVYSWPIHPSPAFSASCMNFSHFPSSDQEYLVWKINRSSFQRWHLTSWVFPATSAFGDSLLLPTNILENIIKDSIIRYLQM